MPRSPTSFPFLNYISIQFFFSFLMNLFSIFIAFAVLGSALSESPFSAMEPAHVSQVMREAGEHLRAARFGLKRDIEQESSCKAKTCAAIGKKKLFYKKMKRLFTNTVLFFNCFTLK